MRLIVVSLIALLLAGCITQHTVIATPGVPMRVVAPFTAPAKATATEISKGVWTVNNGSVTVPAGAIIVVLSSVTTQP